MTIREQPLVSVLMTTYNREKYLSEAIDSVLASTYANFELIIVDDGSTDKTIDIAGEYLAKDARIKFYRNRSNLGDYPNRNMAASYATGTYLKYVDADDYIYPWGLALLVEMMEQFPGAGWGLCSLDQYVKRPFPFELTPKEAYEYHYRGPGLFHKAPLSSIIRRNVFEKAGGFSPQRMVGDNEMWHRLALQYNVLLMPQGIVWYREHDQQEINDYHEYRVAYERISVSYLNNPGCPLDRPAVDSILRRKRRNNMVQLIKSILKFNPGQIRANYNCLMPYYAKKA
jgi:glycosyltransferase involved in cell wall biosynthesis